MTVEDPQEDETLVCEHVQRNSSYLAVGHGVVLKTEFTVWKHKLGIVLLSAFDSPGRIDENDIKFSDLLSEKLPVKVLNITIDEGIVGSFFQNISTLVEKF